MSSFGTIGHVEAQFTADTSSTDAALQSLGANSEAASKKMEQAAQFARLMGEAVDEAGQKSERAAAIQERAAERARRAWQQELIQQDRAAEAAQRSARAKELAALKADILERSLKNEAAAQEFVNAAVEHSIPQYAAASGVIRAMEGGMNNNIRAAERFVTTTLGLGPILQTLFPLAGGLAFLDIILRMTEKVSELAANWEGVRDAEFAAMDVLEKTSQQDVENANEHARMLREQQVTAAELAAPKDQRQAAGAAAAVRFDLAQERAKAQGIADDIANAQRSIVDQNLEIRAQATRVVTKFGTAPGPFDPTKGPVTVTAPTTDARIAQAALMSQRARIEEMQKELKNSQAKILLLSSQYELRRKEIAEGGLRGERKNATQQMEVWGQDLAAQKAQHTMTLDDEAAFWQARADSVTKGSILYNRALAKANGARAESQKQYQQAFVGSVLDNMRDRTTAQESSDRVTAAITEQWDAAQRRDDEASRRIEAEAVRAFQETNRERQEADQIAEEAIRLQVGSGRMSRADAAEALRALHEQSFAQWLQAAGAFSEQFPNLPVPGATNVLRQYGTQSQLDQAAEASSTALGALRESADLLTQRFLDSASQVQEVLGRAFGEFNEDVVRSLTMRHPRVMWGEIGANLGRNVMGVSLERLEGEVMKALGFGGKPDGSAGKPFHVIVEGAQEAGSAVGGILHKLGIGGSAASSLIAAAGQSSGLETVASSVLSMIPFLADGGPIPANMPAIVGERGPELFIPSAAGHVVPNGQWGGAGDTHIHVDARGAHDPAQVEAAVHRAMGRYIPGMISASVAAGRDQQARRPGISR